MDSSYSSGLFGLERIHAAIRRRLAPAQINSTASRLLKKSVEWDRQIDPGVLPCSQYC